MVMDGHINAWAVQRPVYARLPEYAYQDNAVADWLTQWVDSYLSNTAMTLQNFYKELDPTTCQDSSLDFLASLVGLVGSFWDTRWSSVVKRAFITNVGLIFATRGTKTCLQLVISIFKYQYSIWVSGQLVLPFKMSGTFGSSNLVFYLRLPLKYRYKATEWTECERLLKNYAPVVVENAVTYEKYYTGFSRLGQPMFTS